MWRTLAGVVSGLLMLFVGSLAFNAASGQSHWPGPLDLVRVHPWWVLLLLIPVSLIGLWQAPRRDRGESPRAPMTYQLPPRNTDFTGRDATLRELRQRLTSADDVARLVVHGMGGVGKTQLAVEYAYRYLEKYRFVAFVHAENPDRVAGQFVSLAGELGLTEADFDQVIPRVYGKLVDRRPWLIIFDNGEQQDTLAHALPPGGLASNGHVIVTTRVRNWSRWAGLIDLDVFARHESVGLLTHRVPSLTAAVADRIAEELGDLPLALEQAAGHMDYNQTPPDDYLALVTSQLEEMVSLRAPGDLSAVKIAALWQLSVQRLQAERPQAVRLLRLCALLAPEPIPLDLFTRNAAILDVGAADRLMWDTTVGALAGLGLARRGDASLVVHRLVQATVRADMPQEVRTDARVQLCRALVASVPHDIHGDPDARPRWQELLPHVLTVTKDDPPAECAAETAVLLRLASEFFIQIGDYRMALRLCERALAIDESLEGRDAETGFDLITLAQIHRELHAPERARPLVERALALHESCLPANDPAIATDLATLARTLCLLGEHEAALPLAERALEIDEAAHGPDDPYVSFDLIALANVHVDLGNHEAALPLISRALRIREAVYAPDHLYIGYVLVFQAQVLHALNDPTAVDFARRGAQILQTRLGRTHAKTEDAFALVDRLR
ncbi:FxSxx-COOH system tetratricopeptide repeat protein [Streptomyces sp. NPDC049541]|uniref:FxSxx-COOH system tetratricopeptide repeat protein n=1 Tax=Streptomyces sp. NPDC049541 TaxID=3365594 RepID=UPI0037BA2551